MQYDHLNTVRTHSGNKKFTHNTQHLQSTICIFLTRLLKCQSLGALNLCAMRFLHINGVRKMAYHHAAPRGSFDHTEYTNVTAVRFVGDWGQYYVENDLHLKDPTPRKIMASTRPQWWDEVDYSKEVRPEERKFLELAASQNFGVGLLMPLFGPFSRNGYAVLGYGEEKPDISELDKTLLQNFCQVVHHQYCELIMKGLPRTVGLSKREREILTMVAQGLSNNAIAAEIDVTENTVITYLRRAYNKLGVTDRVTAALRALAIGQLM